MVMKTEFVTSADGTRIACVHEGSGPPIVFAHGASGDKFANPDLKRLLRKKYSVISYDRRGRGESGDNEAYDFLKEADDLRSVVAASKEVPIVFGLSMGARIAVEMLRDPPELAAMFLFEAPLTDRAVPEFEKKLEDARAEMETKGNEAGVVLHSQLFHLRSANDIADLRRDAERWKLRVESFPVSLREMEAVHRDCLFNAPNYPAPKFPVHLMTGDSTLPFLITSAELMAKLTYIKTTVLPSGTHSTPTEEPERVYEAFRRVVLGIRG